MYEIVENLFIGDDIDCNIYMKNDNFVIIHACKTCHQKALQYKKSLPQTHPNYLIYENHSNLFLNLVDMDKEFLPQYTHPIMISAMNFIGNNIINKNVLIHCNQGQSRSPSIALIYLAKKNIISNISYESAAGDFIKIYKTYAPGK